MSVRFPETLVLGITTHGSLPTCETGVRTIQVPEGMTVTRVNAIPLGVANMASDQDSVNMSNLIRRVYADTLLTDDEKLNTVMAQMNRQQANIRGVVGKEKRPDEITKGFLRRSSDLVQVRVHKAGEEMIDKEFVRGTYEGTDSPYDFKLNMLNVEGSPDLLRMMASGRTIAPTRQTQYLENALVNMNAILYYVKQRGVKNVVLFDFSCAVVDSGTPRGIRENVLNMKRRRLTGGKKKTKRRQPKKTKTRKANKKVPSWSY